MKKYFLFVFAFTLFALSTPVFAETAYVPKSINIANTSSATPTYNAGDKIDLDINLEPTDTAQDKTMVEYGVVRQIINGNTTRYELVSAGVVEKSYLTGGSVKMKVEIPNVFSLYSTSTYVFYAKKYVINNPGNEGFVVSKQNFKINSSATDSFTKAKYANLLQSNGRRYSLTSGPTIYDLTKTSYKGVSSSTALEITFESNSETVLNPNIVFNKLRSDVPVPDFKPESIKIKKGENKVIIPLPIFNYETGVYQGVLKLNNKDIPDLNFQYIVGGEMVTFGQPAYSKTTENQVLKFDTYGTPIDLNLDPILNNFSTSTIEKMFSTSSISYNTEFILKDKNGQELYKTNEKVDFATTTYSLSVPKDIKGMMQVYIKTVNNDGKVLYEGTKDLNIPIEKNDTIKYVIWLALSLLILILLFVLRHKYVRAGLAVILFVVVFGGFSANAWVVPDYMGDTKYNMVSDAWWYKSLTQINAGYLVSFNENVSEKTHLTNEDLVVTYYATYAMCDNAPTSLVTSVYLYHGDTEKASGGVLNTSVYSNIANYNFYPSYYLLYSQWITVNLGKPAVGDNIFVNHTVAGIGADEKYAFTQYNIPLKNVVDPTVTVVVTATSSNITTTSVDIGWAYNIANPVQKNYKVELATDADFNNVVNTISGVPITYKNNFIDKVIASLTKNYLFTKIVNAQTSIQDTRKVSLNGLKAGTTYFAKVSVYDGISWTVSEPISFPTKSINLELSVSCTVNSNSIAVGGSVKYTATPSNASGTVSYVWKNLSGIISGETSSTYDITYNATDTYHVSVETRDDTKTSTSTCTDVVVGGDSGGGCSTDHSEGDLWGCFEGLESNWHCQPNDEWATSSSDVACNPLDFMRSCSGPDNITVNHGSTYKFWKSRISKTCEGAVAKCVNGALKDSTGTTDFATTTFKYQKCAEPVPVEF